MSRFLNTLCASLCVLSITASYADAPEESSSEEALFAFPVSDTPVVASPVLPAHPEARPVAKKSNPEVAVNPFTGKVKARKVRMRLKADIDSRIIKELTKNELVTIVGEKGDFWAVQAPSACKAYVFRSFVLDNVVEGNHVNVRLEPSLDAPVIGHLNSGDTLDHPIVSAINPKWFEITPPANTHFYIAKEYIEYAGGPDVKIKHEQRQHTAEQILDSSSLLGKSEMKKGFEEIDFERVVRGYHSVIDDFSEFPELVEHAKDALAAFQEEYLQRRITHVEAQSSEKIAAEKQKAQTRYQTPMAALTDKMKLWEPVEEALYLSWCNINDNRSRDEYYEEQKLVATEITGIVEPYNLPVKARPGDFLLRDNDIPVGYIYSTQVNLQELVGRQVRLVAAPRPNNNFAFPAYYVLDVE